MTAQLIVDIVTNASGAVSGFKKVDAAAATTAAKTESAGSKIAGFAKSIGAAFAAIKVVEFGKEAIGAASDLNESMSKVNVVFGKSASTVVDWSKTSATSMGLSQQAALEAAATYGNLAVSLGLPQKTATAMSTKLVDLAGDLASFNNVSPQDALDALRSGMVGQVEPLRRFGVSLSEAAIQAKALQLGISHAPVDMSKVNLATERLTLAQTAAAKAIKLHGANSDAAKKALVNVQVAQNGVSKAMAGSKVTLTAAQKAQAAYAIIMEQTKTAQGDFARTSGGLANQQRIAAAQFANLKATVGGALLPVVVKLAKVFTTDLMPGLTLMAHLVQANAGWLVPLAGALAAVVLGVKAWSLAQEAWSRITKIATGVQAAFNLVMDANPVVLIILAIALLVAGIIILVIKVKAVREAMLDAWKAVSSAATIAFHAVLGAIQVVWNWLKSNWPYVVGFLLGPIGLAAAAIYKNWGTIKAGALLVWNWLRSTWSAVYTFVTSPFASAISWITGAWSAFLRFMGGIPGAIEHALSTVEAIIKAPFQAAWNFIQNDILGPLKNDWNLVARTINGLHISFSIPSNLVTKALHLAGQGFDWRPPFHVPLLASGGVFDRATLAVVGEAGSEVVAPEALLRSIMGQAHGDTYVTIKVEVPATANPAAVGRSVVDAIRAYVRANGPIAGIAV